MRLWFTGTFLASFSFSSYTASAWPHPYSSCTQSSFPAYLFLPYVLWRWHQSPYGRCVLLVAWTTVVIRCFYLQRFSDNCNYPDFHSCVPGVCLCICQVLLFILGGAGGALISDACHCVVFIFKQGALLTVICHCFYGGALCITLQF